jgi:hypothetical protein
MHSANYFCARRSVSEVNVPLAGVFLNSRSDQPTVQSVCRGASGRISRQASVYRLLAALPPRILGIENTGLKKVGRLGLIVLFLISRSYF